MLQSRIRGETYGGRPQWAAVGRSTRATVHTALHLVLVEYMDNADLQL
jgi:hypothetical protein